MQTESKMIVQVSNLTKHFRVQKYRKGIVNTFYNLTTREYELIKAVDDITFQVTEGELIGYIGPNGAGKSTTIKMLTGLLVPTSGFLLVNQYIPWKDRRKYVGKIGAVFGQRTTLWWDLPVIESFNLLQYIYQVPKEVFRKKIDEFSEILEINTFLNRPVRTLSLGQRMRADLCAALLHDPKLLFLDEPTIGLDVIAKERIRNFIRYVNREIGTTVILTTHDLSDVEKLCERVIIIDHGTLLYDGLLDTLRERFGGKRKLVVDFAEEYDDLEIEDTDIESRDGRRITYLFERSRITASELIGRVSSRFRIRDLQVLEPDIENTIRRIYEEKLLD